MRTTIEMKPEHRARILEIAANRGEKGFSSIVSDALDLYLETATKRKTAIQKALALKGSLSESEGSDLLVRTRRIREHWR